MVYRYGTRKRDKMAKKNNQEAFDMMNKTKQSRKVARSERGWDSDRDDNRDEKKAFDKNSKYQKSDDKKKYEGKENKYKTNKYESRDNKYKVDKYEGRDNKYKADKYEGREDKYGKRDFSKKYDSDSRDVERNNRQDRRERQDNREDFRDYKKVPCSCNACESKRSLDYRETVKNKQARLVQELAPFTKVAPMITMDKPQYYKNRVIRAFHHEKNGTPMSGHLNEYGGIDKVILCETDSKKGQEIIDTIKGMLKSFKIKTYDKKSGYGLLKSIMIREGDVSGEIMVVMVLSSLIMPSKNNFAKALRKAHPEITTIIINENYKNPDAVLGEKENTLFGPGFILDSFGEKQFKITSKAHYPLNTEQSAKVYGLVKEWAKLTGEELVLDAYCGSGVGSVLMSDYAKRIISVDPKTDNMKDTIANVKRNSIKNVDVYRNNPAEFVAQVRDSEKQRMDVAVVNQPYMGFGREFAEAITSLEPKKIIIISRNPGTLSKELGWIVGAGYAVRNAQGVDVLPWTEQMQIVLELVRV